MLSNFWVAPITVDGRTYRTVEHYFQAAKIALVDARAAHGFALESGSTLAQGDGVEARKNRKLVILEADQLQLWQRRKHVAMQVAMRAKFSQHAELWAVLRATGEAQLWHSAGRGSAPQRVYDLEAIRNELRGETIPEASLIFRFEGRAIGGLVFDSVQDSFPWYQGTLVPGPALGSLRTFVDRYNDIGIEQDFAPYSEHERPYEQTELREYRELIANYRTQRRADPQGQPLDDERLDPWRDATDAELERYLDFLDWRRWQALHRSGAVEYGIGLPPQLDFERRRYSFRPG